MALEDDIKNLGEGFADSTEAVVKGTAGYKEILQFTLGTKAASVALGLLGETSTKVGKELEGISKAFVGLYDKSKLAELSLQTLTDVMNKDFAKAIGGIVKELKTAADGAQAFQVELVKYGQDQSFQKAIGEQAFALASLGIKYSDLKQANLLLIDSYNASIRISDAQSKSFDNNRNAMSELLVFNKKFGVEFQDTIKILDFTKNTMGGGTEQAIKFSEQLEKFADVTGQKASKVFSEFNNSLDRFSVLSADKAISQFERLEATAARTGLGMSKLLENVKMFDEIDTGFQKGGQLNRILSFMGGSFDTFAAIQADDDERARMITEALAGVSDNFAKLGTEQAKRSMVAQLQQALPGFDSKTIVGILNKSTDLSKDIAEISKMPLVTDTFTDKERTEKMTQLSTSKDLVDASNQLLEATKGAQALAQNLRIANRGMTAVDSAVIKKLDDNVLTPLFTSSPGGLKSVFAEIKTSLTNAIDQPSKTFDSAAKTFNDAVSGFKKIIDTKPATAKYDLLPPAAAAVAKAFASTPQG